MCLVVIIAALALTLTALGGGVAFPSHPSTNAISPDGKWWVICKSHTNSEGEFNHCLLLKSKVAEFELHRFDRACDVLWSPDSSHLAITDWLGSNLSDVLVFLPQNKTKASSLKDLFPNGVIPKAEMAGHCYFEATRWIDAHRLSIRIFGHTDSGDFHEFEHKYVFDLSSERFKQNGTKMSNHSMQRTEASRFAQLQFQPQWRLAPAADAGRYPIQFTMARRGFKARVILTDYQMLTNILEVT